MTALVAVAIGATTSAPRPAEAFCRTLSGEPKDMAAQAGCEGRGTPIYWKSRCIGYSVDRLASRKVSYDLTAQIVSEAFARWGQSACFVDTGSSRVSIDVRDLGEVACGKVGYSTEGENQNIIIFREDTWPHVTAGLPEGDSSTLGLTTVTFNKRTGEIFDADMEINTFNFNRIATQDPVDESEYDLRSIVTHEAGHFLGLAHSTDRNATMFSSYNVGETKKRYPKLDDVLGLCAAYPPDGKRPSGSAGDIAGTTCNPLPRRGLDRTCAEPETCGASGQQGVGWLPASGAVLLGLWLVRRRARRHPL